MKSTASFSSVHLEESQPEAHVCTVVGLGLRAQAQPAAQRTAPCVAGAARAAQRDDLRPRAAQQAVHGGQADAQARGQVLRGGGGLASQRGGQVFRCCHRFAAV